MGIGAAIIGAAVSAFGVGTTIFGLGAFGSFLAMSAIGIALNALTPKPKVPTNFGSGSRTNRGYTVNQRGSALDHQIIYGRMRVGGVIVFRGVTGASNKLLHEVIAYAGHEIESFDEIWINDTKVLSLAESTTYTYEYRDLSLPIFLARRGTVESASFIAEGTYTDTTTPTASEVRSTLGISPPTDPDVSGIEIESVRVVTPEGSVRTVLLPDGTVSNRYDGYVRIKQHLGNPEQSADPNLVAEVPEWTNRHRLRGIAYLYIRYNFDQDVFPNGVPQVTTTIKGKKVYDPRTDTTAWSDNPALCLRDYISNSYGLNEDTVNIDDSLVTSAANVCDETDTDAGTTRYTCNGAFTTDSTPYDTLNDMLTSMGGLLWYAQGKWRMKPAYWTAPTVSFDEDDLRSNIAVKTRYSRRDNFNTVRGTFRGEESDWQITDYPDVSNSTFITADGGQESVADIELPFTDNSIEARRIARIALERNRQQITVSASFGLRAFQVQTGDIIQLSVDRFGWTNKEFEVVSWTFGLTDGQDLQVQMTLREISESVFDEVDDGVVYERDNTELLSPFEVPSVGISVSNAVEIVYEHARNVITADVTGDSDLIDRVEVQYKETGEADWKPVGVGDIGSYRIVDLEDGNYDVRVRSINSFGVKGDWKARLNFPAKGLAPPPGQVQNFSAEVNGAVINLEWDAVLDLDLSYYRIRYTPELSGVAWNWGIDYVEKVAKPATSVAVPARSGTFMIKAVDQGERESTEFSTVVVTEADLEQFTTTLTQTEDPDFTGTKTDCIVTLGNELQIQNTTLFDGLSGNLDDLEGEWDFLGTGDILNEEGIYEFSDYIDIGSVKRARVRVDAYQQRFDTQANLFDNISGQLDTLAEQWDSLTDDPDLGDTTIVSYVSTTEDDPAGTPTWTDYKRLRVADISARAFRFKVELKSNNPGVTPSITELDAVVQHN